MYLNRWEKFRKDNYEQKYCAAILVMYNIDENASNKEDYFSLQNNWIDRFNKMFPEYKGRFFVILMPLISGELLEKRIMDIIEYELQIS